MAVSAETPAAAVKQCLHAADQFIKQGEFQKARAQLIRAKQFDSGNPYISAFEFRIKHFEESAEGQRRPPAPTQSTAEQPHTPHEVPPAKAPTPTPSPTAKPVHRPASPDSGKPAAGPVPPASRPVSQPSPPKPENAAIARPDVPTPQKKFEEPRSEAPKPASTQGASAKVSPSHASVPELSGSLDEKILAMQKQIADLTADLERSKRARKELSAQDLQQKTAQFRTAAEKAWQFGAPNDVSEKSLRELASSLALPSEVESTVQREVKLEMYGRAVKEVVAKRKLLRSSSSTLEWLRKVYRVSVTEYLEYESRFLLDLVADQFRGTLMFVCDDDALRLDITPKLKKLGFAIVHAASAESALEKIEQLYPTLILCNMEFREGVLGGVKFLHVLRASSRFSFIPFLFLCDEKEIQTLQSSELRPNEGYVPKPVDFEHLSALINDKLLLLREYLSSFG